MIIRNYSDIKILKNFHQKLQMVKLSILVKVDNLNLTKTKSRPIYSAIYGL